MSTSVAALNPAADPVERAKGIGGSDIPAILGLSPYKTALDVYLEKRGLWDDPVASEAAHWGTVMEPVLALEYVRRFGIPIIRSDPFDGYRVIGIGNIVGGFDDSRSAPLVGTLTHPECEWARGHVDGIGLTPGGDPSHVCEFKIADSRLSGLWGDEDTDQVPEFYLAQVMWYLMLTGLELGHLSVLIGGNRFRRYIIRRDDTLIGIMLQRGAEFWERVQNGDPPAPAPGEAGKESLARLYPKGSQGKEIDATPELRRLAIERHRMAEIAKEAEERKVTIDNEIKMVMADASRLNLGGKAYISWKNNKDVTETDWKGAFHSLAGSIQGGDMLAAEAIAAHTTTRPGPRVFRGWHLDKLEG